MASLNEGEWSCYKDGQFNGGRMIMLISSVQWRENSQVMEVASLMEGVCYIGGQFNGGRMVMLEKSSL